MWTTSSPMFWCVMVPSVRGECGAYQTVAERVNFSKRLLRAFHSRSAFGVASVCAQDWWKTPST